MGSDGHVVRVGARDRMRQRYPDLVILPAHDPGAAARLAQVIGQTPTLATA